MLFVNRGQLTAPVGVYDGGKMKNKSLKNAPFGIIKCHRSLFDPKLQNCIVV